MNSRREEEELLRKAKESVIDSSKFKKIDKMFIPKLADVSEKDPFSIDEGGATVTAPVLDGFDYSEERQYRRLPNYFYDQHSEKKKRKKGSDSDEQSYRENHSNPITSILNIDGFDDPCEDNLEKMKEYVDHIVDQYDEQQEHFPYMVYFEVIVEKKHLFQASINDPYGWKDWYHGHAFGLHLRTAKDVYEMDYNTYIRVPKGKITIFDKNYPWREWLYCNKDRDLICYRSRRLYFGYNPEEIDKLLSKKIEIAKNYPQSRLKMYDEEEKKWGNKKELFDDLRNPFFNAVVTLRNFFNIHSFSWWDYRGFLFFTYAPNGSHIEDKEIKVFDKKQFISIMKTTSAFQRHWTSRENSYMKLLKVENMKVYMKHCRDEEDFKIGIRNKRQRIN